jgi:hypothetical protein
MGRWLTYCPRLNLETKEIVYTKNKKYFSAITRKAPPVCEETLRAEIDKFHFTNPQFYFVDNSRYGPDAMKKHVGI